jgi:predicted nucleotidyltransferase
MNALPRLHGYLEERRIRHALIGGHALAARGYARFTLDIDLLTTDKDTLKEDFWAAMREDGGQVAIRPGDSEDPLRGVIRIELSDGGMVDIVVGKYQWQQGVIERAEPLDIGGITIPVARSSDLILLKLFANGPQDLADIRAILETTDRNEIIADVRAHLAMLPKDCLMTFDEIVSNNRLP